MCCIIQVYTVQLGIIQVYTEHVGIGYHTSVHSTVHVGTVGYHTGEQGGIIQVYTVHCVQVCICIIQVYTHTVYSSYRCICLQVGIIQVYRSPLRLT